MDDRPSVEAVKLAKRTPAYRACRDRLTRVVPVDVWAEGGHHLVLFGLPPDGHFETVLAFRVDVPQRAVLDTGTLTMDAVDGAWRVENAASGAA